MIKYLFLLFPQLSENSSLLGEADTISERVRFDDNVSFIDADADYSNNENKNTKSELVDSEEIRTNDTPHKMSSDESIIKKHECYGYDNVTVVNDDLGTIPQRAIKVCQ